VTASADEIAARWREVRGRVDQACVAAGRAPDEVTVIAVSKRHPAAAIRAAVAAGARDLGENYVQELIDKRAELDGDLTAAGARWHFIGHLQRNKARMIAGQVALVHAVDSVALAIELGKRVAAGAVQPIALAVNVGGEATKHGCGLAEAPGLARELLGVPGVRLDGLMTMPPPADDPEASRPCFEALRALRDRLAAELGVALPVLSMGMSDDFEVAIGCGATHVRIGTAIFGERV
jgi:pyridoxal phosphate enzyme (YggS family)